MQSWNLKQVSALGLNFREDFLSTTDTLQLIQYLELQQASNVHAKVMKRKNKSVQSTTDSFTVALVHFGLEVRVHFYNEDKQ